MAYSAARVIQPLEQIAAPGAELPVDSYDLTVTEIEDEMDRLWPAWDSIVCREGNNLDGSPWNAAAARGTPFNHLPYPILARVKWLLKRRLHLLQGQGNWGVMIAQDGLNPKRCYAHPVPPHSDGSPARPPAPVIS